MFLLKPICKIRIIEILRFLSGRQKLIFILFFGVFIFDGMPSFSKCIKEDCILEKKLLFNFDKDPLKKFSKDVEALKAKERLEKNKSNLRNLLVSDGIRLDKLISNFFYDKSEIIASNVGKVSVDIESNIQYRENDVLYAEGNVVVYLPNGKIKADKIEYDQNNKTFKAKGNIIFESGEQFLFAEYLEFDNKIASGFIDNVYGILNIPSLKDDLKIETNKSYRDLKSKFKINEFRDSPTEINFLNSSNVRLSNKFKPNSFQINFREITKWRFKSERLEIKPNAWFAKLIYFTNDPYNKPQFLIKSKNFSGEIVDQKTKLKSQNTSIIFDDKITIPIGRRTIDDDDALFRWGVGYDKEKKDGLFILRNFDPINIGNNTSINLQGNFHINRLFSDKTSAFRKKDSNLFSNNIEQSTNFADLFGLNSDISIDIDEWNLNIQGSLNSLNFDRLYDSFSGDLLLNKNLVFKDNSSLDFGFYSSYNAGSIWSSYGSKLISSNSSQKGKLSINKDLVLDIGSYNAKKNGTEDESLISGRYGLNTSISFNYNLIDFNNRDKVYGPQYKYKPNKVNQGLNLNASLGYGIYDYSAGNSQSIASLKFGKSLIIGEFEKEFLDFTSLSIMPEFVIKNGKSSFDFDDFNATNRIKIDLNQQLFGPILLGVSSYYIIDGSDDNYGKFVDDVYSLGFSRRAYELSLNFNRKQESISLNFEIFNFGYKNFSNKF